MTTSRGFACAMLLTAAVLSGCASAGAHGASKASPDHVSAADRIRAIQHASVWAPTQVASMDIVNGPRAADGFAPNATVTCTYLKKAMSGKSPKFACVIPPADEVKVKFGAGNGEVFGEVAATRLLWALGFGADRVYPVAVVCQGCPSHITGTAFATIQRKAAGHEIETKDVNGWAWPELALLSADAPPEMRTQRGALTLLAAFLQHTDSKREQQRVLCVDDHPATPPAPCEKTLLMMHDVGLTFGAANRWNRNGIASVNLARWAAEPVWKDPVRCVANLAKSATGTLENPVITEAARRFLADLLVQLTDAQLHDLFTVARFDRRSTSNDGPPLGSTVDQWVDAFKAKRAAIADQTCPAEPIHERLPLR